MSSSGYKPSLDQLFNDFMSHVNFATLQPESCSNPEISIYCMRRGLISKVNQSGIREEDVDEWMISKEVEYHKLMRLQEEEQKQLALDAKLDAQKRAIIDAEVQRRLKL